MLQPNIFLRTFKHFRSLSQNVKSTLVSAIIYFLKTGHFFVLIPFNIVIIAPKMSIITGLLFYSIYRQGYAHKLFIIANNHHIIEQSQGLIMNGVILFKSS